MEKNFLLLCLEAKREIRRRKPIFFFAQRIWTEIKLVKSKQSAKVCPFLVTFILGKKFVLKRSGKIFKFFASRSETHAKHSKQISFRFVSLRREKIMKQNWRTPNLDPELSFIWPRMFLFHKFLINRQTKLNHQYESRQLMQTFPNLLWS